MIAVLAGRSCLGIFWGIRARTADATLRQTAAEAAISLVSVVSPKRSAPTQEILPPGATQASTDAPIFGVALAQVRPLELNDLRIPSSTGGPARRLQTSAATERAPYTLPGTNRRNHS